MMAEKRRQYTEEFKREAIRLVTEQGYGVSETARNLGINAHMLGRWKREFDTTRQRSVFRSWPNGLRSGRVAAVARRK